ncbi:MAG TPA: hypothetical protein PL029_09880 [Bacteroidia bacterium]|nr:hypothetical protein [Bacteroidia bacterium]
MRNIIYLSILSVLIILSACKGNSFLSQRYTQFPNGHKHGAMREVIVKTKKIATPPDLSRSNSNTTILAEVPSAALAALTTPQMPVTQSAKTRYQFRDLPLNAAASAPQKSEGVSSQGLVINKKMNSQSTFSLKGVVSDVLAIVLWVILLAVLVCAIIIIVLVM